ncbi:MAG: radical SAM protein, partial [Deltaproteobacteria bacterium]|nr:radical SAM protein [Deltaproteobacteria bacterium]
MAVDHARGEILRLNLSAGELLDRVEGGETEFDEDEQEFLETISDRGWLTGRSAPRGASSPQGGPVPPAQRDMDLMDEINKAAAKRLVPLHCQLELTYRCRLRCQYCYLGHQSSRLDGEPDGDELSTGEVVGLLDQLRELGGLFLLLTGGEPLLRPDLLAIVEAARERRFAVSLLTSGWRLERAKAERLAALGLDGVQVSIHGADARTHDGMTGVPGSFEAALSAIELWKELGVRAQAAVTVTTGNVGELEAVKRRLDADRTPVNVSFYVMPCRDSCGDSSPQNVLMDESDLRRAMGVFPQGATPRMGIVGLDDVPCGAGMSTVSVDPHGLVYPCHSLRIAAG